MEENAELIQAINKYCRWKNGESLKYEDVIKNVIEEVADVEVMVEEIKYLLNLKEADINKVKQEKLDRQIKRMEEIKSYGW